MKAKKKFKKKHTKNGGVKLKILLGQKLTTQMIIIKIMLESNLIRMVISL